MRAGGRVSLANFHWGLRAYGVQEFSNGAVMYVGGLEAADAAMLAAGQAGKAQGFALDPVDVLVDCRGDRPSARGGGTHHVRGRKHQIKFHVNDLQKDPDQDLFFREMTEVMEALSSGLKVLIFCVNGKHRSPHRPLHPSPRIRTATFSSDYPLHGDDCVHTRVLEGWCVFARSQIRNLTQTAGGVGGVIEGGRVVKRGVVSFSLAIACYHAVACQRSPTWIQADTRSSRAVHRCPGMHGLGRVVLVVTVDRRFPPCVRAYAFRSGLRAFHCDTVVWVAMDLR